MKRIACLMLSATAAAILISGISSCSRFGKNQGQSTEFATFVKAYTGGIISDKSTIRVELATDIAEAVPGADIKEGILSFTPPVKGTARWLSQNTIEFIPEAGALKPGQSYTGRLRLDKIQKVSARKFKKFTFKFLVAIKEAILSMDGMTITATSPELASISGTISLTEELPLDKVQKMIQYDYPDKSAEASVTAGTDPLNYHFDIVSLPRETKDRTLKVSLKSGDTGFVTDSKLEIKIPAMGDFKVLSAERVEADDPFIDIYFTEPLADLDDDSGLFTLEGVGRSYCQVENSHVKVFYESPQDGPVTLHVSEVVKSYDGTPLGKDYSKQFTATEEKPAVEIPITGNILPNSRELILPFKAVNLNAVDIRIIQIYEDNVLMFLQENGFSGEQSLRRCGRLVYKRCLRLDSDPSKNLHKWQDFSVDLSGLFKQEAGAIYRIRISFKPEYSIYGKKASFKSGTPTNELVNISSENVTEEDDSQWDRPYPHFWESSFDWDEYVWEDRDNPLKPTYYMQDSRFPQVNLLASNLGVIAKYSGGDKIWVSVSDILSTDPVFNAELYVYSYQLKEIGYAKTGTDGMAEVSLSGKPFVVVAKRGGATSYLKVTEGDEKSLSRFDVGGKELEKGLKAFIYGERGVWRPGDTLHVALMLDDRDDRVPDNHPAIMEVYTPEGQFYTKQINSNARNGLYVFNLPTKSDDPTGTWNAWFKIGGASFRKALRIESIKPNRLKIDTGLGEGPISGGERVPVNISANWLTGPAASGLPVKVNMTLRRSATTFKGFEGYDFTAPLSEFVTSEHNLVDTRLNEYGKTSVSVEMPAAEGAPGMLTADIVTTVEEQGGDFSFSTMSVPYSPYISYVGIKVPKENDSQFLETDKEYKFAVAVVDKDGKRVAGDKLEYSIYKLKWSWWWESRSESLDSYVNGSAPEALASGTLTSSNGDSTIPFKIDYPEWGRYLLIVRNTVSGHTAGQIFYVDWPEYRGRSAKTDPDGLTMLSFSTDKDSYKVGEKVTVYIPAAAKGNALISLENAREVISREWVKTTAEADVTYTFKVTPEMAPNFYIHVTLVQPHERVDNDLPIRLYGVRPITVSNEESHLEPVITMPEVLRPAEEFSVKIKEKSGKPMTYTLAIVDEGLLDITGFKTPDPWSAMYAREALGVRTWDLYDDIIGAYSGRFSPMFSIGGDESTVIGAKKDNRFNAVVKFLGPFSLQNGSATHKVTLPMYIGSVRVMVVAARDGAYGNAEKTVPVRSPLMVLPTLPRVLGTGEKVTLPVNVFALEDGVRNVEVDVKVEGPAKLTGSSKSSVTFSSPGDQMTYFGLEATGTGTAKVTVTASGNGYKASETISLGIRNPEPPVVTVTKATVGKGETRHFGYSPFEAVDGQWASLCLATFPAVDYSGIFSFIKDYPYYCSEQIASKGLSLLSIRNMLTEDKQKEADKMIPELLQQLYQRQLGNGGFSYWPGASEANNWVSSMAGEFMIIAAKNGFSVSKGVLASWSRFQKKGVQEYRNTDNRYLWDLEQAYRLFTLALNGEAESGAMNRLKESENLSSQAGWMLASAYAVSGKKSVAKEISANLKTGFTDYQDANSTFGSPVRDKAIALETMVLTDDIVPAMELAEEVSNSLSGEWYVTQETAFATKALSRLAAKVGTGYLNAQVSQGGAAEQVKSAKSAVTLALDPNTGGVDATNQGDGIIYATLVTSAIPKYGEKVPARSNGISLTVNYISNGGQALSPYVIPQGTDFTSILTVSNVSGVKDYTNLALTEAIPSGWEIFNDRLAGGEAGRIDYSYRDIRDDRVIWFFDLPKGTAKTFRVKLHAAYEGEFVLPAVKCEAMYDSKVSANTASGTAKVSK
ncbi:MAG: alpha-2-macroglobulin [Bacteroidales bacterium]|nr:alpha-2-macroglobulin [Bacteroidales bacterium]